MPYASQGAVSTDEISGGIEITNEQYAQALEGILAGKVITIDDGFKVDFPALPEIPEDPEPTLDQVKSALKHQIDTAAESERGRYITRGSGQAMTYIQKASEAKAYLESSDPDSSDYPLLSAEIGITAPTLAEVAATVRAAFSQWQQIGAAIEAVRLGAKAQIDASDTAADAQAAYATIVWP